MRKTSKPSSKNPTVQPKLRCFVAMAFGREDTDAVYEQHMAKAIEAANMIPIRVDRVVHIDRIDAKIRAEIAKADIVVADLTYARPSVYWEAGYAERQTPVIYTGRSDHFAQQPDDKYGNFRVHFDLQNANIIPWSGTGNRTFQEKLRKMLLYASRSIRTEKSRQEQVRLDRQDFSLESQTQQKRLINEASSESLKHLGYKALSEKRWPFSGFYGGARIYPAFWKRLNSTLILVARLGCAVSLTRDELQEVASLRFDSDNDGFVTSKQVADSMGQSMQRQIESVRRIMLRPVLGPVAPSKVARAFPSWRKVGSFTHYANIEIV